MPTSFDQNADPAIAKAANEFFSYKEQQLRNTFMSPSTSFSYETSCENRTDVWADIKYNNQSYACRSITSEDAENVYVYLNSQPIVREKYLDGKTPTWEATQQRIQQLSDRFNPNCKDGLYLYGGFILSDAETQDFLGMANLGGSTRDGYTEIAGCIRADAFSHQTARTSTEYQPPKKKLTKQHTELGILSASLLFQYAQDLKNKKCKIKGKEPEGVQSTARTDNPGSWKSVTKAAEGLVWIFNWMISILIQITGQHYVINYH